MIVVERRYEHYTRNGKEWTDWFTYDRVNTLAEAKAMIKKYKEPIKGLKGDYRIKEES